MAVCANGTDRETIERDPGTGNWWPATGQPWPVTDGHTDHSPALMTTIELIRAGYPPATCQWCAFPREDGALYLIGGKGCCETHVERAMREITAGQEAAGIMRDGMIGDDRS